MINKIKRWMDERKRSKEFNILCKYHSPRSAARIMIDYVCAVTPIQIPDIQPCQHCGGDTNIMKDKICSNCESNLLVSHNEHGKCEECGRTPYIINLRKSIQLIEESKENENK